MAQHNDLVIDDQTGSDFLPDLNSILTAILTQNSGNDEPPVKVPFMYWAETDADTLWQRNAANDGWINRGSLASGFGALALLSTVDTDQIEDDAVTSAKIASGTAGKYLGFDGSGNPAELDPPSGIFTESFESSEQTITTAGQLVLAHGLSAAPALIQPHLVCKTAELGYSIGDISILPAGAQSEGFFNNSAGASIVPDETNITVRYGATNNQVFAVIRKDNGVVDTITTGNWKLVLRAWA